MKFFLSLQAIIGVPIEKNSELFQIQLEKNIEDYIQTKQFNPFLDEVAKGKFKIIC